jgi:hypothetical protein
MANDDKPKSAETEVDPMEQAKRIMKRLAETPHSPHQPLGKRPSKNVPITPKAKERPASKGRPTKRKVGD